MTETPVNAMTRDDVLRMAREAANLGNGYPNIDRIYLWRPDGDDVKWLVRFAALVAAAEREACAKICETLDGWTPEVLAIEVALGERRAYAVMDFAAAIRART
jgi:hypothetical protein